MAGVEELEALAALEEEYGVEASSGGGLSEGVYAYRIHSESEVRNAKQSGAPRLMVKVEVTDGPQEGRKAADFFGWFGADADKTKVVRSIFYTFIKNIAENATSEVDIDAMLTAFRGLPKGNAKKDYGSAQEAMVNIVEVIEDVEGFVKVTRNGDNTRLYFIAADHKDVLALLEAPQTV